MDKSIANAVLSAYVTKTASESVQLNSFGNLLEKIAAGLSPKQRAARKPQNIPENQNTLKARTQAGENVHNLIERIRGIGRDRNTALASDALSDKTKAQLGVKFQKQIKGLKGSIKDQLAIRKDISNEAHRKGLIGRVGNGGASKTPAETATTSWFSDVGNWISNNPKKSMLGAAAATYMLTRPNEEKNKYASIQNEEVNNMNNYFMEKRAAAEIMYNDAAYDMQYAEKLYTEALQKMASAEYMYKEALSKEDLAIAVGNTANTASNPVQGAYNQAYNAVSSAATAVGNAAQGAYNQASTAIGNAYNAAAGTVRNGVATAQRAFSDAPNALANTWAQHPEQVYAPVAGATVGGALGATAGYQMGKRFFNAPRAGAVIGGLAGGAAGGIGGYAAGQYMTPAAQ